jgi:hypothetical protein
MPIGPSSSMVEKLLNHMAQLMFKADSLMMPNIRRDQINQYLNPDKDIIPRTDMRPQSITKFGNQIYRSQKDRLPSSIILPTSIAGKDPLSIGIQTLDEYKEPIYSIGPESENLMFNQDISLARRMGLGSAKTSIRGGKNPYISIFDSWDDPSNYKILDDAGTPFNIYDRIPISLDEHGKIPKIIPSRGQDIELPSMRKRKR